jgi:low affinity Fe/Cu permease
MASVWKDRPTTPWDARTTIISILTIISLGIAGWAWSAVTRDVDNVTTKVEEHLKSAEADRATIVGMQKLMDKIDRRTERMEDHMMKIQDDLTRHSAQANKETDRAIVRDKKLGR